jgi:hypothetical protein
MLNLLLALAAATPATPLDAALQPLAFLAGACWQGELPAGQGTDTHCFMPMLGGHFLRDRHRVMPGGYAGETIYRWDPAARRIAFDYYSSPGMLMPGTAAADAQGLAFEFQVAASDGRPMPMRATWRRDGADAYVVTTEVRQDGAWHVLPGTPRFRRIGPAPAE